MPQYAQIRWDSSTGTPGLILKEGTMVQVITKSKERWLVEVKTGDTLTRVWVDANDLEPPPKTRYERLTEPDEI